MSMLVELFWTTGTQRLSEVFDDIVSIEPDDALGTEGAQKASLDDRVVTRWFHRRATEAECQALERLFRWVMSTPAVRVVVDRGVGKGTHRVEVPAGSTDGSTLMRAVLAGEGDYGCGVVEIVVA